MLQLATSLQTKANRKIVHLKTCSRNLSSSQMHSFIDACIILFAYSLTCTYLLSTLKCMPRILLLLHWIITKSKCFHSCNQQANCLRSALTILTCHNHRFGNHWSTECLQDVFSFSLYFTRSGSCWLQQVSDCLLPYVLTWYSLSLTGCGLLWCIVKQVWLWGRIIGNGPVA